MKILLVDDSKGQIVFQKKILGNLQTPDLEIDDARNGIEAIKLTKEKNYHLVISDINMPEMTGLEFVTELRKHGNPTPIVILTSEASQEKIDEAMEAGADNYLVKPILPEEYLKIVKRYI